MRLFAYYAIHSVKNTFKKLFKTWLAIIIMALVVGVIAGVIASAASSNKHEETSVEETVEVKEPGFLETRGIERDAFVDFLVSLGFLGLVAMNVLNAKNSGKMFKPGDVVMLFSSPLKPQSVLMFRLMSSIGATLLISIYMLFQVPNLVLNLHMSLWGALSIIIAFGLAIIIGTLFQVTFYTLSSRKGKPVKNISKAIGIFYGIIALAYVIYTLVNGRDYLNCAIDFFAGKKTFFVPFWGWVRGFCYFAGQGETLKSLIYLGVIVVGSALLIWFIWRIDCDFYEDAITSAEKQAELLESARQASKGGVQARTKERKANVSREGFAYGFGASVFFFKPLYNRIRFSKLKIFSTTSIVYIVVTALVIYLTRALEEFDPFLIVACALGVMVFYRTMGNPLGEDVSKSFFLLAPEKASHKLFYSMTAGLTITLMDLLVPALGAAIFFGENPLSVLAWILFILSIDFFGTSVGTFINVSVPGEVGASMKVMVQVMFLYFGLAPSVVAIIAGVILGKIVIFAAVGAVLNILIGLIFFGLISAFLEKGNA